MVARSTKIHIDEETEEDNSNEDQPLTRSGEFRIVASDLKQELAELRDQIQANAAADEALRNEISF
jgi:hypothetical protein